MEGTGGAGSTTEDDAMGGGAPAMEDGMSGAGMDDK